MSRRFLGRARRWTQDFQALEVANIEKREGEKVRSDGEQQDFVDARV